MIDEFFIAPGEVVSVDELQVPKARQLAKYLLSETNPWAHFVEARYTGIEIPRTESVVVDVDVEVSQVTQCDIRSVERICVTFTDSDNRWPEVLALRSNFPLVPHCNLRAKGLPRSLCLYEQPYADERLRWTIVRVVERIRAWLSETASGILHKEGQALEPLLLGARDFIILPPDIQSATHNAAAILTVFFYDRHPWGHVYIAQDQDRGSSGHAPNCIAITYICPPVQHGVIRSLPENLLELHRLTIEASGDLLGDLYHQLGDWQCDSRLLQSNLIIIVHFPKTRAVGGPVESVESWVFVATENAGAVGEALNLWQIRDRIACRLIGTKLEEASASGITLSPLIPITAIGRDNAAKLNGVTGDNRNITAIGMGALGSQATCLLARSGYGIWTLVDGDIMLPHNFARHALPYPFVGHSKAEAMKVHLDSILAEGTTKECIFADFLNPGIEQARLDAALENSDAIVDFSASISVARHLALGLEVGARRVSAFLNPSGTSLIVLSEDAPRCIRLDALEMQYYRAVLSREELKDHFKAPSSVRYARSCGDASSTLAGYRVALHAAIAARAIRTALAKDAAGIDVWIASKDDSVQAIHIMPSAIVETKVSGWMVVTDKDFVAKTSSIRARHLPNETGGILLGVWDFVRRLVYIVDTIPAPWDSKERATSFIRGCEGLKAQVDAAGASTGGMLQYVGEWHSHPDGFGTLPSSDDCLVFGWINEMTSRDGYPPVMLIVGANCFRWFVERPPRDEPSSSVVS